MSIARSMDLDLVEVAAEANPPVCRIMDFNRFKYETAQRAKESRRKTTSTSIKEMKYRPKIGTGDFDTKTRQVARFLGEGHKVKITIMFRGREMSHPELGKKILDHVADTVGAVAKVEAEPKLDGRNMIMVLAPDRRNRQPAAQQAAGQPAEAAPAQPPAQAQPGTGTQPVPAQPAQAQAAPAQPVPRTPVPAPAVSPAPPGASPAAARPAPSGSQSVAPATADAAPTTD